MPAPAEMKVLVVGSGGREHALCWKLAQSERVTQIFCAPGNGGTASSSKTKNIAIKIDDFDKLATFAKTNTVDLIVVGADNPLANGIVDHLQRHGLTVFGPTKEAARLEWSKTFAKQFMLKHSLPTPSWVSANDYDTALKLAVNNEALIVKYDGLALGKGVFVCQDQAEVEQALKRIFIDKEFGENTDILLEERKYGEELSLLYFCDGQKLVPMPACQDHKRRYDADEGPNTGGMGAYCPVELYMENADLIHSSVTEPLEKALRHGDIDFRGVLFVGLLVDNITNRPYILEFNARFGDPETQALMPLLDGDLALILFECAKGDLSPEKVKWKSGHSCCVVAVASDYPKNSSSGEEITLEPLAPDTELFHAGTALSEGRLVTAGGRIIAVAATASSLRAAKEAAYAGLSKVKFAGMDYRVDVAERELSRA
ncbi:MAG TPA: phosphoribosylamine--glycine ligase [Planktothrix sp.]|jgi:phosphoribosylamine--glycine ligase